MPRSPAGSGESGRCAPPPGGRIKSLDLTGPNWGGARCVEPKACSSNGTPSSSGPWLGPFPHQDPFLGFSLFSDLERGPPPRRAPPRPGHPPRRRRISMSDASGRGTLGGRDSPRHIPEWKGKKEEAAKEEARANARGGERGSGARSRRAGGSSMPLGPRGQPLSAAGRLQTRLRRSALSLGPRPLGAPAFPDHP